MKKNKNWILLMPLRRRRRRSVSVNIIIIHVNTNICIFYHHDYSGHYFSVRETSVPSVYFSFRKSTDDKHPWIINERPRSIIHLSNLRPLAGGRDEHIDRRNHQSTLEELSYLIIMIIIIIVVIIIVIDNINIIIRYVSHSLGTKKI